MKKLVNKMRKIKMTPWHMLTFGEKLIKAITTLVKYAIIAALVVIVGSMLLAVIAGIAVAFAIAYAIAGGFYNASKAYIPGDVYVKDRKLM